MRLVEKKTYDICVNDVLLYFNTIILQLGPPVVLEHFFFLFIL